MCGIIGVAYLQGAVPHARETETQLKQAAHLIQHRGPDDEGTWVSHDSKVGLAHRRLSILDLSPRGHQPMVSSEGDVLTYNGEIYNFRTLRTALFDQNFNSQSDTEVLLKGLGQFQDDYLNRLDGMFAFGFYSKRQQSVLLAVDPAGEKPIYTYWDGKIFAFASEIKAFFGMKSLDLSVNRDYLKESLIFGYVPWPNTMYRFIRKLPAGHFQRISLAEGPKSPQPYWELPLGVSHPKLKPRDAEERLKYLLGRAVEKRLVADVPVGCFLSGGLDSSTVALEAEKLLPKQSLQTFAAGFSLDDFGNFYDETPFANMVARRIESRHRVLQIDASNVDATDIMRHFDEPFGDSSAIPTYLLCQETARHVKVVLSGDGGDELFGGYLRFCGGLLSENYQNLWQFLLAPVKYFPANPRTLLGKLKRFQSAVSLPLLKRLAVWNAFFTEEELSTFFGENSERVFETVRFWEERTRGLTVGEKILHFNFKTYLFDDLLPKVDRMSMAHGLEVRSPFLDRDLIEFAFSLPTQFKFDSFRTKKILKNAYRFQLGAEITDRAKHGFAFPLETFLRNRQKEASPNVRRFFPNAKLQTESINPMNRFSKKFMLWCMEQSLGRTELGT